MVRIVVTTVLVVVISMTLQIPEVLVSAYMVIFVAKENKVVTTLVGALIILVIWLYVIGLAFLIGGLINAETERASMEKSTQ